MTGDDDAAILILAPFRSHAEASLYPTSRVVRANCGHLAWLSPRGVPYIESCYTQCDDCRQEAYRLPDEPMQAVAGALDEIEKTHGPEARARTEALMRTLGFRGMPTTPE